MSPRAWGDGVGRKPSAHRVADISFTERPCRLTCSCGTGVEAPTADALQVEWNIHRAAPVRLSDALMRGWARREQATDTDVSEFLTLVGGSRSTPTFDPETWAIS